MKYETITYHETDYLRKNWRCWEYLSGERKGERVNDIGLVTQLEKAYSDAQRASVSKGPRPPVVVPEYPPPPVRKAAHRTPRESRGKGRVE